MVENKKQIKKEKNNYVVNKTEKLMLEELKGDIDRIGLEVNEAYNFWQQKSGALAEFTKLWNNICKNIIKENGMDPDLKWNYNSKEGKFEEIK